MKNILQKSRECTWLLWDELTESQKEQAQESYMLIREEEEERTKDDVSANPDYDYPIDPEHTQSCRFEVTSDGYVYVDI